MGHADPFAFDGVFKPAAGIARFLTGTPSILALAALESGLSTFDGIEIEAVENKSRRLSELFISLVEQGCGSALRLASRAIRRCAEAMSASPIRKPMR